jgi:hypothetical protein
MSSELERILREGRQALGEPDAEATRRAREAALGATLRRRLLPPRRSFTLAFALLAAVALGIGLGAWATPSGTAAQEPAGIGFLPADGWFVVQNAMKATEERPAHAIASNVPLGPGDGGSTVPYATLRTLPADGIVLVANFVVGAGTYYWYGNEPQTRSLPLRVADATRGGDLGRLIRPNRPLGQYTLRARVKDHFVDLHIYFGTRSPSRAVLAETQTQLDRLIVAPDKKSAPAAPTPPLATADDITLRVQRIADTAPGLFRIRFSGQIASAAAGEYVVVMQQRCGYSYSTAVAGAQTQPGGFWEVSPQSYASVAPSATFRARWGEVLSDPVTILQRIHVESRRLGPGLFAVYVSGSDENLARRPVFLQRLRGGTWTGIQRSRLNRVFTSDLFQARFTVKARGWKLRARVPKATAGKCLAPAVSKPWTS